MTVISRQRLGKDLRYSLGRLLQIELALLDEQHRAAGGDCFGKRTDVKYGLRVRWLAIRSFANAISFHVHDFAVANNADRDTGHVVGSHHFFDDFVNRIDRPLPGSG